MNKETVLRGLFKLSKQIVTSAMDSSAPVPEFGKCKRRFHSRWCL